MKSIAPGLLVWLILLTACIHRPLKQQAAGGLPQHPDTLFRQDVSIQYFPEQENITLYKAFCDRNGRVSIHSSAGLLTTHAGAFLYPGTLVADAYYRPMQAKKISAAALYQDQLVYLDDKSVFSNAWAGKLFLKHTLPGASVFAGGGNMDFLLSGGLTLQYLANGQLQWQGNIHEPVKDMLYDKSRNIFWLLGENTISTFAVAGQNMNKVFEENNFTCFALANKGNDLVIGTSDGYFILDASTGKQKGDRQTRLPCTALTTVQEIDHQLWFGSERGAFMLRPDGKFDYYASRRWLPSDKVQHIAKAPNNTVLILTGKGLGEIHFREITLHDKAMFFEKQVRQRHIRNGFNATIVGLKDGRISTGSLEDSDNDGLWTAMYLGSQVFRYAVTHSPEALQNCRESLEAMERLYTINPVPGFPSRSFERRGYALHDKHRWVPAADPEWDWKSTTSSDEAIGHIFAFGTMAELIEVPDLKNRAINLIDTLMQHILDHNLYLTDYDGKPTQWGKWHPDYVNARPAIVGDRKLNSSNIVAMLQTAYHFTKKEKYKEKAFELMYGHGYLENLMRPMKEIGMAPDTADELSKSLSDAWNHSDDEMYFLGYWGLYRYAFSDSLKNLYKKAILDHWEAERPEKEGAWNIFTAITRAKEFDLKEAIWYLQEYPMDLISWQVQNSHRKDIEPVAPNFRNQTIREVLPPDELPISRHNANRFGLDGGDQGESEYSAGDIWLLPYWMGRYLGIISGPVSPVKPLNSPADHKLAF